MRGKAQGFHHPPAPSSDEEGENSLITVGEHKKGAVRIDPNRPFLLLCQMAQLVAAVRLAHSATIVPIAPDRR